MSVVEGDTSGAERPPLLKAWLSIVEYLGRSIGRTLLSHASLVLAVSGIGLYLIGVVRTVGILRAEGIPIARGLPVVALQDYLLRGLSVVAKPQTLLVLLTLLTMVTFVIAIADRREGEDKELGKLISRLTVLFSTAILLIVSMALIPVAEWLPMLPGAVGAIFCIARLDRLKSHAPSGRSPRTVHYVAGLFCSLAFALGMRAYFFPPPLDQVRIVDQGGDVHIANLFYGTGPTLYTVGEMNLWSWISKHRRDSALLGSVIRDHRRPSPLLQDDPGDARSEFLASLGRRQRPTALRTKPVARQPAFAPAARTRPRTARRRRSPPASAAPAARRGRWAGRPGRRRSGLGRGGA